MSIESIASPPSSAGAVDSCAACGAPLDEDQRYCLQCGERRAPISSTLLGGRASGASSPPPPPLAPVAPPSLTSDGGAGRGSAVTVIAGVGVLLLAMGIGVLIGRSGSTKPSGAPAQVISVAQAPGSAQGAGATPALATATFSDDWPAGLSGYSVQLQTLPLASTQVSAVLAAKTSAGTKGAKHVGALKSEDFAGLPTGNYVVYSGEYHKQAEAKEALAGLRKSFPGAKVIKVSGVGGGAAAASPGAGSSSPSASPTTGAGSSESHPASPAVVEKLKKVKPGSKNYEQESKNLPNVISTG